MGKMAWGLLPLGLLHEAVDDLLRARFLEIHRQLIAFDRTDPAIAEFQLEDARIGRMFSRRLAIPPTIVAPNFKKLRRETLQQARGLDRQKVVPALPYY